MKIVKKSLVFISLFCVLFVHAYPMEMGVIGGTINKPSENFYGLSASFGFFVPLLKVEVEYWTMTDRGWEAVTSALKLRKKFGRIAPYAVLGVGAEFESFTLDNDKYDSFMFVGGGIHFSITELFSIRGDIRFLNFSGFNKTRLSVGLFLHL